MIPGLTANNIMLGFAIGGTLLGIGGSIHATQTNTESIKIHETKMDTSEKIQIKQTYILEGLSVSQKDIVETQKEQNKVLKKLLKK